MSARGLLAAIVVIFFLFIGALSIAAGFLGDLSGQHRIFPIPILVGVGIIAAVVIGIWRSRSGRRPPPATAPGEPGTPASGDRIG